MIKILKDLRPKFSAARDQAARPTCIAFAASDVHAASRPSPFTLLSVEYLYYHAVRRSLPSDPHAGVSLPKIAEALEHDGQPVESDWPYLSALPHDLAAWKPPLGAPMFRATTSHQGPSIAELVSALDSDRVPMLVVRLSKAFYQPDNNGIVSIVPHDATTGYHAVIGVGHGLRGGEQMLLVRNSWGASWGIGGYGWLYASYLQSRLLSVSFIA